VITKLTESWKAEQRAFGARDLSGVDYVYLWADGITSTSGRPGTASRARSGRKGVLLAGGRESCAVDDDQLAPLGNTDAAANPRHEARS
jgi:hypothetical protein